MMLLMRRKVYAELGASCAGVSDPPHRWHSGPGVKLRPRDPGWFVVAHEWPQYSVERGSYVILAEKVSQATALATADGRGDTIALARIFCSRQDAEREAEVLETFAGGRHKCANGHGQWCCASE